MMFRAFVRFLAYFGAVMFAFAGLMNAYQGGVVGVLFLVLAAAVALAVYDPWSRKVINPKVAAVTQMAKMPFAPEQKPDWSGFKKTVDRVQR
jgi:hypothetical protein